MTSVGRDVETLMKGASNEYRDISVLDLSAFDPTGNLIEEEFTDIRDRFKNQINEQVPAEIPEFILLALQGLCEVKQRF